MPKKPVADVSDTETRATSEHAPDLRPAPRSLDHYELPRAFKPTWRTLIPRPIKNFIRMWMERFGVSS